MKRRAAKVAPIAVTPGKEGQVYPSLGKTLKLYSTETFIGILEADWLR